MMYNVDPGELNRRIQVLEFDEASDGAGGYQDAWPDTGWTEVCKRWARIEPLRGSAFFEAQQSQSEITHRFTVRYTDSIKRQHTINYDSRRFDIDYVINVGDKGDWLEIMAVERV